MKSSKKSFLTGALVAALSVTGCAQAETSNNAGAKAIMPGSTAGVQISPDGKFERTQGIMAAARNPGVNYWIELVRPGNRNIKRVSDSHVFKSGDKIRIHVAGNSAGSLYALHRGSSGSSYLLPVTAKGGNRVGGGQYNVIPSDGGWLKFDRNRGREIVQLVFTPANASVPAFNSAQAVMAAYNQYSNSKGLESAEITGSKDLVAEGVPTSVPVGPAATEPARLAQVQAAYRQPGRIVVNTANEPVAVEIKLKHQ